MLRALVRTARSLLSRSRLERDLDAELTFHVAQAIEQNVKRGMTSREARRVALAAFGQAEAVRDECRQAWGLRQLDTLVQDVRYGVRTLRRHPGFAATAVLTLALGIGATTVVFSVVDSILFNPVPFRDPDRLAEIWFRHDRGGGPAQPAAMLPRWREQTQIFEQVEAHWQGSHVLTGVGEPEAVYVSQISVGLLPLLGVNPRLGRGFAPDESEARIVLISHELWTERLGQDPGVIGRSLRLDDDLFTVVGVMPAGFRFPVGQIQLWIPFDPMRPNPRAPRRSVTPIVRLREHLTLDQADVQVAALAPLLDETLSSVSGGTARLQSLNRYAPGGLHGQAYWVQRPRTALFLIFGAAGLVLLVSCANSANLFLSRAIARARDLAVRAAVGGSRSRLVRQMVTEGIVVAAAAGALGLSLAAWSVRALAAMIPADLVDDSLNPLDLDGRAAAWAVLASLLAGTAATLVPALRAAGGDLIEPLKGRSQERVRAHLPLRGILISVETALALVLVVGAGLMARSLWTAMHVDMGWSGEDVMVLQPQFRGSRANDAAFQSAFFTNLAERIRQTPGVRDAAIAESVPLDTWAFLYEALETEATTIPPETLINNRVSTGYFSTLGIPLHAGRSFDISDEAAPDSLVVTLETAQRLWPGQDPIGRRLRVQGTSSWLRVVGVVGDVRSFALDLPSEPLELYRPLSAPAGPASSRHPYRFLVVRTDGREGLVVILREQVREIDPNLPVRIQPMDRLFRSTLAQQEFYTTVLMGFALLALLLAGAGVYAVVAYETSRRTQELGIRVALGATRADVIRHVMGRCLAVATVGVVIGLGGAYAVSRLMRSMLYEIQPTDPATFAGAALFLLLAAVLAGYVPARRATRVNPVEALRTE